MIFGERLKQLRRKKYSQEELASLLHVHNNTISKWENGTQEPRAKKVKELADVLGTTTAYLLGDTDNPLPTAVQELGEVKQKEIQFEVGDKAVFHKRQQSSEEHSLNNGMLVYEINGERFEAPPTDEGMKYIAMMRASIFGAKVAKTRL